MNKPTQPLVLRKSNHARLGSQEFGNGWAVVENIQHVKPNNQAGNYLYLVDGIEYQSRSQEWDDKLYELQTWSKLQNV